MRMEERLNELVSRELDALEYELVKLETRMRGKRKVLRIFIDHPERNVTIDDCVRVTKAIGFVLDGEDLITGSYNLEVSSPGIDRPLTRPAHFLRFRGERVKLEHLVQGGGRETLIGDIVDADDDAVTISAGGLERTIAHGQITKANLHGRKWDVPRMKSGKGVPKDKRERR